ncbi:MULTISPECIES: YihY/virulence factor BrkB family protein [unclassified Streptomyces]|uniref:YihY/virulence factor BrkB family protein n=1 Tax=unclassified Streptomyces TaxID=2593676 RepID=UPI0011CE06A6|nr:MULTISPECIES: YihY/virulence factor BrkB family protein [unclassified Streptomyces]TXS72849.1 YihY/virulence factor BrkB family protein [Streptomyces sp. me109]
MDWLRKLPGVGPLVTRLMATHAWRSYERLDRVKWTRLAAAMTFVSFVALFPLLTVAAAIGAATLSVRQQRQLQDKIAEQVPGISDQLDINTLVQNAGTIGVIAGAVLLLTGIGWVGQMRDCLRAVWELPDSEENPLLRKLVDGGVLVGLGGAVLVTIGASAAASTTVGWTARLFSVDQDAWGGGLLRTAAFGVAVLADFLLLLYLLTLLPGVQPSRHRLVVAALIGAAGFELLKLLLSSYMRGIASKSMYGAFGVPVALLLWINFTAKLLLFCASWTATEHEDPEAGTDTRDGPAPGTDTPSGPGPGEVSGAGAPGPAAATGG